MIAVATGIMELDKQIQEKINNLNRPGKIINYRDFFLKENFDTVILSSHLKGDIELEQLIFYLKNNDARIIFLTEKSNNEEIYLCFKYGIYDMIFDPVTLEGIVEAINTTKGFSDYSKLFIEIMNGEKINNEKRAVLKQVLSKISPRDTDDNNQAVNNELQRIKEMRSNEKKQFEESIAKLKKKLQAEEQKAAEVKIVQRTVRQQILTFYTASNEFLKEKIIVNYSLLLAGKSDNKVIILDFKQASMLDSLLNLDLVDGLYSKENLQQLAKKLQENISWKSIEQLLINVKLYKNIQVFKIGCLREMLNEYAFFKLLDFIKENYDTIIINMGSDYKGDEISDLAIKKSTYMLVVVEGKLPVIKIY